MTPHGSSIAPRERTAPVARLRRAVAVALDHRGVLRAGESVLVACSGGPDSSALLDALVRLAPPRRIALHVVHVDHGLRLGSDAEATAVQAVAEAAGLAFSALTVEVPGEGSSLMDRARTARHLALRRLAESLGATAIATGHTADDQAETVLMRALSGATPRALAAMGERDGIVARPLLHVWRDEVLAYCQALAMVTLDDPSNGDVRFLRSRVRHELLPALENVFPAARRRLCVLAERQRRLLDG